MNNQSRTFGILTFALITTLRFSGPSWVKCFTGNGE